MTQDNASKKFSENANRGFPWFMGFPFDMTGILQVQEKHIHALLGLQLQVFETLQTVAMKQGALMSEMATEVSNAIQKSATTCPMCVTPELNAELIKKSYKSSVRNWQEITDTLSKSSKAAADTIEDDIADSMEGLKPSAHQENKDKRKTAHRSVA
jgi:hypothetical protein